MPSGAPLPPPTPSSPLARSGSYIFNSSQQAPVHGHKRPHAGSANFRKSVVINAANQAVGNSQVSNPTGPSTVASQLGQANIQSPRNYCQTVYNPSIGPVSTTVSQSSKRQRTASGHSSNNSRAVNNGVCKMSGRTRQAYRLGEIISLPFHTANTNPNVSPSDNRLVQTVEGPAYSKRRMMIVMWIHEEDMFCLPLYTFMGTGLRKKPRYIRDEFVSMKNWDDSNFYNQGNYPAVEADTRRPLHPDTTIHLTGGVKVSCNEDISFAGRVTRRSFYDLLDIWRRLSQHAQNEAW